MDSTHKTVRLKWYLFTIFVRDDVGSWIPASFFMTQKQDAEIIEACLRLLIEWCGGLQGWVLKYMLTDDSAAEQLAVRNAFGYDPADENPRVQHLLCTKHSWETLKKRINNKKEDCRRHMLAALYARRSEETCLQSVDAAIECAGSEELKQYLRRYWRAYTRDWAHWFRDSIPLLCQITTTNVVESWHAKLKDGEKKAMSGFSLKGGLYTVMEAHADYMRNARNAEFQSRGMATVLGMEFNGWGFAKLPLRVQKMILRQIRIAQGWRVANRRPLGDMVDIPGWSDPGIGVSSSGGSASTDVPRIPTAQEVGEVEWCPEQDEDTDIRYIYSRAEALVPMELVPQLASMPQCRCRWFRAWQLPCRHIWLHHFAYNSLQPAHFGQLFFLWENNGFEVYEEIRRPFAKALDDVIGVPRKSVLQFNEIFEQIRQKQFEIVDFVRDNNGGRESLEAALGEVVERIRQDLSWIPGLDIAELVRRNDDILKGFEE